MASGPHLHFGEQESASAPRVPSAAITSEAVRDQLDRILSDPLFHNSKRYSSLLKFIVDHTLNGGHASLKERIIGIEVYGKTADYDTALDSTVRVAATEVRRRLAAYYIEKAHGHEIRIDLPTRSYIAEFKAPEVEPEPQPQRSSLRIFGWIGAAIVMLLLSAYGLGRILTPAPAIDRFWAPMLKYPGPIAISIGSGPSENLPATNSSRSVAPAPGLTLWDFLQQKTNFNFPLTDVTAEAALTSYFGRHDKECVIRFAQTTTLAELRGQPLILLGSFRNDWTLRFGSDFRFKFNQVAGPWGHGLGWIEDARNPAARNWAVNFAAPYDQVTADYALVTRAFDRTTGQWWIGIGGVTGVGTLAAQQMLLDPAAMTELSNMLPKDWDRRNLQIVLSVKEVKGSPGAAQVAATYSW
jgi:hypothetical protein